jgi:hypothetical protein
MTQDVATSTVNGELETPQDFPELRAAIRRWAIEAEISGGSSDEFVMGIMERILTAETEEAIFEAQKSPQLSGKDFHGRPFYLKEDDITIRKSTQADGLPFYALFKVTELTTNEEHVVNCGGRTFMAVLDALRQKEYFHVTEERPNGRALVIIATPSPAGAYLQLAPVKVAAPVTKSAKNGAKS